MREFLPNRWVDGLPDTLPAIASQVFFALCGLAIGAIVGSFLNVVVHRVPRGRSPIGGRSHCPACGTQILARDNLPVLSWILLGGRCRTCMASISPRYPLVEASCGVLFLFLCVLEVAAGGWNLPGRPSTGLSSAWWTPLDAEWDLVATFLYHAGTIVVLLIWALIDADGNEVPVRQIATALFLATAVPAAVPAVHPVSSGHWVAGRSEPPSVAFDGLDRRALVSAFGAIAGALAPSIVFLGGPRPSRGCVAGFALVGVAFGWQAVLGIAVMTVVVGGSLRLARYPRARTTQTLRLAAGTVLHLVGWRWLDEGFAAIVSAVKAW